MSLPKILVLVVIFLFVAIGIGAAVKKGKTKPAELPEVSYSVPLEIELDQEIRVITSTAPIASQTSSIPFAAPKEDVKREIIQTPPPPLTASTTPSTKPSIKEKKETESQIVAKAPQVAAPVLPEANRIEELFNKADPRLPFVETVTYQSRVAWQKGRPAWLSDYASHYQTSRHFIARSLNGKPEYFKQDVSDGDRFNVLRLDRNISFYLVIDTSRNKMWFYSYDKDSNQRILIKTYAVGLGRLDSAKSSGSLTPLGQFSLGSKIAIYKPKMMGYHNGQKTEMMRIFGTRWIPFDKEIGNTTAPAKGFGIHGVPWVENDKGQLVQDSSSVGKKESDGCVRLATADMEELFAVIITRPTTVNLVKDFYDAALPGVEK